MKRMQTAFSLLPLHRIPHPAPEINHAILGESCAIPIMGGGLLCSTPGAHQPDVPCNPQRGPHSQAHPPRHSLFQARTRGIPPAEQGTGADPASSCTSTSVFIKFLWNRQVATAQSYRTPSLQWVTTMVWLPREPHSSSTSTTPSPHQSTALSCGLPSTTSGATGFWPTGGNAECTTKRPACEPLIERDGSERSLAIWAARLIMSLVAWAVASRAARILASRPRVVDDGTERPIVVVEPSCAAAAGEEVDIEVVACGQPCDVTNHSYSHITCRTRELVTPETLAVYRHRESSSLRPAASVVLGDMWEFQSNARRYFDGDLSGQVYRTRPSCQIGLQILGGQFAVLTALRFYAHSPFC